jgi:hypothetical protein
MQAPFFLQMERLAGQSIRRGCARSDMATSRPKKVKTVKSLKGYRQAIGRAFATVLYRMSPALLARYRFRRITGRRLILRNPRTFDERLLWLMLYWRHPLKTQCADKYGLRSYVKGLGRGHILPELLGVYDNSREIDFDQLPERFVLKCTHGSGFNVICTDRSNLDTEAIRLKLNAWMKTDFSTVHGEIHYAPIRPRIICEPFMGDSEGNLPLDYKVYCFDGKAHCTMACADRGAGGPESRYRIYDREWRRELPYIRSELLAGRSIPKPDGHEEMIAAAEVLSGPFPFVRMDFYSLRGQPVLGEMTFTPAACIDKEYTDVGQRELGRLIRLPEMR